MDLIGRIGFDQSFSFIYSERPGTPAAELPDRIIDSIKQERLAILQDSINDSAFAISTSMIGSVQQVLIDGYSRKNPKDLSGRTANNRVINFNGASDLIGNFVNVLVSEALPNSLRGTLVSADVAES